MPWRYKDGTIKKVGRQWQDEDGIKHPWCWDRWDDEAKASHNLTWEDE
jgi:hypothetical protein|tara:strand:- start:54 stop:197 length:144 start_codon:yes stop_codon:yes gene_type:complete